jgi:hypothetical protein
MTRNTNKAQENNDDQENQIEVKRTRTKNINKTQENTTTNTKSLGKQQLKTPIEPMRA